MKILHLSTYDFGGAFNACYRIHESVLKLGLNSQILVGKKRGNDPRVHQTTIFPPESSPLFRVPQSIKSLFASPQNKRSFMDIPHESQLRFKRSRDQRLELFTYPLNPFDLNQQSLIQECDLIHLHWVADFLDWQSFFWGVQKPIVWTLHDQNPFLGGQHYAERFLGMDENGFPLRRVCSEEEKKEEQTVVEIKKLALKKRPNLQVVCPSKWMLKESSKSELLGGFPHFHIPYGIPPEKFHPMNPAACREVLGLPAEGRIFLFVAESLNCSRKGFTYLLEAAQKVAVSADEPVCFCAIGNSDSLPYDGKFTQLGYLKDERLMCMAYNAADAFILPSLEDNLPNTLLESLMCGTPVIGFPTGGIPDAVVHQQNGLICSDYSVGHLADSILEFLRDGVQMSKLSIGSSALKSYQPDIQATAYSRIYDLVLG